MHWYNENDPRAAAWIRELIAAGEIPDGVVDERSILDVQPADVAGFVQCHWFAGISGWPLALRLAGWPEDKPVWTGSCPCQSFSCAGKGKGVNDPRHLWPEWFRLIKACQPQFIIGEQVAAAIGHGWLDGVCDDLEGEGYTTGAAVLAASSVGAPHIRQRLYWCGLANTASPRCIRPLRESKGQARDEARMLVSGERSEDGGMGDTVGDGTERPRREECQLDATGPMCGMGHADEPGSQGRIIGGNGAGERIAGEAGLGFWDRYELIACADGKQRRVPESGILALSPRLPDFVDGGWCESDGSIRPLAKSVKGRAAILRGAGNSIVPQVAAQFIRAVMDL